jgi:hypothetical protein
MLHPSPLRVVSLFIALGSLAGCSEDEAPPDEPCNALVNDGPGVMPELLTAGTTPMGGTIEDGTYEQTGLEYYPDSGESIAPDPRTLSGVFEFTAGSLQAIVGQALGTEQRTDRYSTDYAASGLELTLTYSCPEQGVVERPRFTATPTEVRLFYRIASDSGTAEVILTKR